MTQPSLWEIPEAEPEAIEPRSPAAEFFDRLERRLAKADKRTLPERQQLTNGHLFWALIRALQRVYAAPLATADDTWLAGRRREATVVIGSQADGAMHEWLTPTPRIVNTVARIAEGTTLLQFADGHPYSSGEFNRVIAVENAQHEWEWRSVAPWWQAQLFRPAVTSHGPRWTPYCTLLPLGAPKGVLTVPAGEAWDYDSAVADLARWYELALRTGKRWTCAHGLLHHPRRGNRDHPGSCHSPREEPCDGCCVPADPYGGAS